MARNAQMFLKAIPLLALQAVSLFVTTFLFSRPNYRTLKNTDGKQNKELLK
jgi:hypothetical protein